MTSTDARNLVISRGSISTHEQSAYLSAAEIDTLIVDAVMEHSSVYTSMPDVPQREIEAVLLLALERVQLRRSVAYATEKSLKGAEGFGTDRNTPYYKCIDSANMLRKQYEALVAKLGIESKGDVIVSTISKQSVKFDRLVPDDSAPSLPDVTLAVHSSSEDDGTGTTYTLQWTMSKDHAYLFFQYHLFHMTGSSAIFQPWNYESTKGVPHVNNDATKLLTVDNISNTVVKVSNITKTGSTVNRFLLGYESRNGYFNLSNELALTGTA